RARRGRVGVLEGAEGIGDLHPVVVVDLLGPGRGGVGRARDRGGGRGCQRGVLAGRAGGEQGEDQRKEKGVKLHGSQSLVRNGSWEARRRGEGVGRPQCLGASVVRVLGCPGESTMPTARSGEPSTPASRSGNPANVNRAGRRCRFTRPSTITVSTPSASRASW